MKTIEITLYKFNELPEEVQDKVITNNRYINTENSDWWYFSFDTWKEVGVRIEHFDLYKMDIGISLFYSEKQVAESILSFLGHNENYDFARRYLEYEEELGEAKALFYADLKNTILDWLREEMEYCESDQAIIDTIEANDYDFDINGKIYW